MADGSARQPLSGGYRQRIYASYVSAFKQPGDEPRDEASRRHARFFDHLLGPLLERARPRKVLEVGCGMGHFLYWARERGIESVRGLDASNEQVEAARAAGLPAEAASADEYLADRGEEFDLIVALDVLEHLSRDEAFRLLDLCLRALCPGGYLFMTTPNGAALRPGPVLYGDLTHETVYSPNTIRMALRLSGYDQIAVREIVPPPTSLRSRVRGVLWAVLRIVPMLIDLIETGGRPTRIYSRVMAVEARRPLAAAPGRHG